MKILDSIIEALKKVNTILKMIEDTMKWHWKVIILLAVCGFIYWAFKLPTIQSNPENTAADTIYQDTVKYQ